MQARRFRLVSVPRREVAPGDVPRGANHPLSDPQPFVDHSLAEGDVTVVRAGKLQLVGLRELPRVTVRLHLLLRRRKPT